MSIFDDSRCAENQVDDREPESAQADASGEDGRAAHEVDLAECAQDIVTKVRLDYFVGESREYDGRYELTNDEAADYVLAALHALEAKTP